MFFKRRVGWGWWKSSRIDVLNVPDDPDLEDPLGAINVRDEAHDGRERPVSSRWWASSAAVNVAAITVIKAKTRRCNFLQSVGVTSIGIVIADSYASIWNVCSRAGSSPVPVLSQYRTITLFACKVVPKFQSATTSSIYRTNVVPSDQFRDAGPKTRGSGGADDGTDARAGSNTPRRGAVGAAKGQL